MKLSIIIPTLNEEEYIRFLLQDIEDQALQPYEVIVVDCGSEDQTQIIVKSFQHVTVVVADKPVGNQRTRGGEIAKGDMLLFLDADVKIDSDFIKDSLEEISQRELSVACPQYIPYPGSSTINLFYRFFNTLFQISEKVLPSGAGSGIFVSKKVFSQSGGFDSRLTFDDIKFIRTASKVGTFGMLHTHIGVSDRRIRKYGLGQVLLTYLILSIMFLFGFYKLANYIPYGFGIFRKTE